MGASTSRLLVISLTTALPSLLFLHHPNILRVATSIACRLGCVRIRATIRGEQRHASHMHRSQTESPVESPFGLASAMCVESKDSDTKTSTETNNEVAGSDSDVREDGVWRVQGLESQVFLELVRVMAALLLSYSCTCRARRSSTSERVMRSRRTDAQSRRQRRSRRFWRRPSATGHPEGSMGSEEDSSGGATWGAWGGLRASRASRGSASGGDRELSGRRRGGGLVQ